MAAPGREGDRPAQYAESSLSRSAKPISTLRLTWGARWGIPPLSVAIKGARKMIVKCRVCEQPVQRTRGERSMCTNCGTTVNQSDMMNACKHVRIGHNRLSRARYTRDSRGCAVRTKPLPTTRKRVRKLIAENRQPWRKLSRYRPKCGKRKMATRSKRKMTMRQC